MLAETLLGSKGPAADNQSRQCYQAGQSWKAREEEEEEAVYVDVCVHEMVV